MVQKGRGEAIWTHKSSSQSQADNTILNNVHISRVLRTSSSYCGDDHQTKQTKKQTKMMMMK